VRTDHNFTIASSSFPSSYSASVFTRKVFWPLNFKQFIYDLTHINFLGIFRAPLLKRGQPISSPLPTEENVNADTNQIKSMIPGAFKHTITIIEQLKTIRALDSN